MFFLGVTSFFLFLKEEGKKSDCKSIGSNRVRPLPRSAQLEITLVAIRLRSRGFQQPRLQLSRQALLCSTVLPLAVNRWILSMTSVLCCRLWGFRLRWVLMGERSWFRFNISALLVMCCHILAVNYMAGLMHDEVFFSWCIARRITLPVGLNWLCLQLTEMVAIVLTRISIRMASFILN